MLRYLGPLLASTDSLRHSGPLLASTDSVRHPGKHKFDSESSCRLCGCATRRAAVASAMSVLLAASPPAKDFALHSGFAHHLVSSLHDRIAFLKLQHARTPVDGGRKPGKGDPGKSDEHIVLSLRILSGLLNRAANETKEEVISMGLPQAVHKLLSSPVASCQPGGGVFGMAMEVMANMSAGCEEGRLALARGYGGGLVGQQMTLLKKVRTSWVGLNAKKY